MKLCLRYKFHQQWEGHFLFQHLKAQTCGLWSTHVHALTLCSHLVFSSKCTDNSSFGWFRKFSYHAGSVVCSLRDSWKKNVPCCLTHEQCWQVMLQWTVQCFSRHRGELDRMTTTEVWLPRLQATQCLLWPAHSMGWTSLLLALVTTVPGARVGWDAKHPVDGCLIIASPSWAWNHRIIWLRRDP